MLNRKLVLLLIMLFGILVFSVKGEFGTKVGGMRVNGTSNNIIKNDLKSVLPNTEYSVINLPQNTSAYLSKMRILKSNYAQGKKFIMYDSAFDNAISCPFGRAFQEALQKAKSYRNKAFFDFYIKPQLKPFVSKEDMEKMNKIDPALSANFITKEEADVEIDFSNTCGLFCIVNPDSGHVISFSGVGQKEAAGLQNLLDYLKDYDW